MFNSNTNNNKIAQRQITISYTDKLISKQIGQNIFNKKPNHKVTTKNWQTQKWNLLSIKHSFTSLFDYVIHYYTVNTSCNPNISSISKTKKYYASTKKWVERHSYMKIRICTFLVILFCTITQKLLLLPRNTHPNTGPHPTKPWHSYPCKRCQCNWNFWWCCMTIS